MASTSRGRHRGKPPFPAPHPGAVRPARGPAQVWVPRLPPAAAAAARGPHPAPDSAPAVERPRGPGPVIPSPRLPQPAPAAVFARKPANPAPRPAPPNPSPLEPHLPRAPTRMPMPPPPPASSSSSSSSSRPPGRGGRNRVCWRKKKGEAKAEEQEQEHETRDWAALPLDAISVILRKLDHIEILLGPGKVCRSWRHAARDEPSLWRRIDMLGHPDFDRQVNLYAMAEEAIRRAKGQCEAFWGEYAADDDVLHLLGDEAPSLKSLRLISCQNIVEFEEEIKKFPLLEELEISLSTDIDGKDVFEEVGKACPELKHFRFNKYCFHNLGDSEDDDSEFRYNKDDNALGIATMHRLRSLQLFGNDFTNEGLTAILDNCPHLEFFDIRHCYNIQMDDALQAKCAAIKTLKLPWDSTDDYNLQFEGPIWSPSDPGIDSDTYYSGGYDYILDSDEYDDYCDPMRYLNGVYESELGPEERMFLKGMRMLMRDDDDDDDDDY